MRRLIWRELIVIARTPAYWLAIAAHVLLLAAFVLVWGEGVPAMDGTVLRQITVIQTTALLVVLPWVAIRCGFAPTGDVAGMAALFAVRPTRLLGARWAALIIALGAVAVSGLPFIVVAQQISAVPFLEAAISWGPVLAMCGLVSVVAAACPMVTQSRMLAWICATAVVVACRFVPAGVWPAGMAAAIVVIGAISMIIRADSKLTYDVVP